MVAARTRAGSRRGTRARSPPGSTSSGSPWRAAPSTDSSSTFRVETSRRRDSRDGRLPATIHAQRPSVIGLVRARERRASGQAREPSPNRMGDSPRGWCRGGRAIALRRSQTARRLPGLSVRAAIVTSRANPQVVICDMGRADGRAVAVLGSVEPIFNSLENRFEGNPPPPSVSTAQQVSRGLGRP